MVNDTHTRRRSDKSAIVGDCDGLCVECTEYGIVSVFSLVISVRLVLSYICMFLLYYIYVKTLQVSSWSIHVNLVKLVYS